MMRPNTCVQSMFADPVTLPAGRHRGVKGAAMLACLFLLASLSSVAHAQHRWIDPPLPKPHPVLWRVAVKQVDVIANGHALRWMDGDCAQDKATSTCITRIYMLPAKARDVHLACSYQYEMKPGYVSSPSGFKTIPTHAPYMQHWPITLKDETNNHSIASLWSAPPVGHVYAHMHITYDSHGKITAKYIDYNNPDQGTCDQKNFSNCYWDVDPRRLQVVQAPWHPTPGDHVLACTLHPLHGTGWYPSAQPISRVRVHVPYPPKQVSKVTSAQLNHPMVRAQAGARAPAASTPARQATRGGRVSTGPSIPTAFAKPRLVIRAASASLTHSCDPRRLVMLRFTVVNEGGPLVRKPSDSVYLLAKDSGSGSLQSTSMGLPGLAHGQSWSHTMVLGTQAPLGKLPGTHRLVLYTGPAGATPITLSYLPSPPFNVRLDVPAGYCQVRKPRHAQATLRRIR
jgi:hypothetical protein